MTQTEWDRILVSAFYRNLNAPMWILFRDDSVLQGLRRVPFVHQFRMPVARFVSGYLPKLGSVLWESSLKDTDRIVAALANSKMDTRSVDPRAKPETKERMAQRKQLASDTLAICGLAEHHAKCRRSSWTTCK